MTSWRAPADLLALALWLLRHFAIVLALASVGLVLGAALTRRLSYQSGLGRIVVATGLGLTLLGHLLLGLGLLGLLTREAVGFLFGSSIVIFLAGPREWLRSVPAAMRRLRRPALIFPGAILLAPLFLLPLYPPTAFDATMYHLPYAKAFVASGHVPFLPALRFPVFPQHAELLFAALMLWSDDVAAQCLQAVWTLLTAGLLFVWGSQTFSRVAGCLAAALFLGGPIVIYTAGTAYVEPALVFFCVAAVYAFGRWKHSGEVRWLAICAVFAASAGATKYLGLFWVLLLGLAVLVTRVPGRRSRAALLFFALTAALLLPWYLRIAALTGNPVFPYLPRLFGSSAWDLGAHQIRFEGAGDALARLVSVVRLPWDLVFARERFDWHPPYSPFYLLAAPLVLLAALRNAGACRLLLVSAVYAAFLSFAPPDPRYLLPSAALLALPAAAGAERLSSLLGRDRWRPATLAAACLLLLSPGWLYGMRQAWHRGPVPVTAARRDEHLSRFLPAHAAIRYLNRAHGERFAAYAFFAENMPYFAEGRFWGDWFGPGSYARVRAGAGSAEALHRTLRALGITHLLVLKSVPPDLPFTDPRFPDVFILEYADDRAEVFALELSARSSRTTSGSP